MVDLTLGKKFDRVSGTWVDADVYDRRRADMEERAFQRRSNQGELTAPMIVTDGQPALRSMTDGKVYDSKSEMRKEYRRAGVVEVGTEKQKPGRTWTQEREKRAKQREQIKASLHMAHSRMGFGAA